jgi:hypothetical protein
MRKPGDILAGKRDSKYYSGWVLVLGQPADRGVSGLKYIIVKGDSGGCPGQIGEGFVDESDLHWECVGNLIEIVEKT